MEVTKALLNYLGMMTSMMAYFRATLMISLLEPDLKEPPVPKPWEHSKDTHGVMAKEEDRTSK